MKLRPILSCVIAMLALASVPAWHVMAGGKDDDAAKKALSEFKKGWKSKKVLERRDSLEHMPYGYEPAVKEILNVFDADEWSFRQAAVLHLIQEADAEVLAEYVEAVFKDKRPAVQEHVILGLCLNETWSTPDNWARAGEIMRDKKVSQKAKYRMVQMLGRPHGLEGENIDKPNVELLIDLLDEEVNAKKPDTQMLFLLVDALESQTSEEFGQGIQEWRFWWRENKDQPLKPRTAENFKDPLGDIELEGHSFVRKSTRKVEGLEVLILPEFGYSGQYWLPYIFELNKTFNCIFCDLPDASRVNPAPRRPVDREGNEDPNAYYYPLEQLVDAFEMRRETTNKDKVGIIAHGVSGWIALEYCRLHPESVAFAIIIGTWSGNAAYTSGRVQAENSKEPAISFYGRSLVYDPEGRQGYNSFDDEGKFWADTGSYRRLFADAKAVEQVIYPSRDYHKSPGGGQALVPEFEFEKGRKTLEVPVLLVWGKHDAMYVEKDSKTIGGAFKDPSIAIFESSSRIPWVEEPVRFFEEVDKLLEKANLLPEEGK